MIPDLGNYAVEVISAYGLSLIVLGFLIVTFLVRNARVKQRLADAEARKDA
ncbi:MAG: heme exporter protein CcmD [Planktomarina sp.]|nr:heme exporter protein CcmD [Planktomarina sp.]|tara:strand:+ start:2764 stop:2916 length:153 start_codon:yes stop_codon:yes gene_type:complete